MGAPKASRLQVRVVPGAAREGIERMAEGLLKVRVAAPAQRGRANAAVVDLVARTLGLRRNQVRILRGLTSPTKLLEITGLSEAELRARL